MTTNKHLEKRLPIRLSRVMWRLGVSFISISLIFQAHVYAESKPGSISSSAQDLPEDLTEIGLENLLNLDIRVTTASKKEQKLLDVASAMFVLTQEDIRRSGATHIADILRLVPGVHVAQINSNKFAISVRGFNETFVNNLLVLIDGRTIVTPLFNGVHWEVQDLILEDIERIEVIRGPGASLWGARAVNGVINIITKKTSDTIGALVTAGGGTEELFSATVRYGGELTPDTSYRVFSKYTNHDSAELNQGGSAHDAWDIVSAGARLDTRISDADSLVLRVDAHLEEEDQANILPILTAPFVEEVLYDRQQIGTSLGLLWNREISDTSDFQLNFDHIYERWKDQFTPYSLHVIDAGMQHRFLPISRNDVVYGAGYRFYSDETDGTFVDDFDPADRKLDLYKWFFHDDITLVNDRLHLVLGSRFEKNSQTGFEYMPNGRLIWTPMERMSLWASVTRTTGTASRVFDDVIVPRLVFPDPTTGMNTIVTVFGDRSGNSEELVAYELGGRSQISDALSIDITGFFFDYDRLSSVEPATPFVGSLSGQTSPGIIVPLLFQNKLKATEYGVEFVADWRPVKWWHIIANYSFMEVDVEQGDSTDTVTAQLIESAPMHMASIRSSLDLFNDLEFDSVLRYVDSLKHLEVDSYTELDLRLGWQATKNISMSIIGRNLLESSHEEFVADIFPAPLTDVERSVFAQVAWAY